MYVRQAKQFLRNSIEGFDERKFGFTSIVDLLRAAGKEGVLRIERDRQGAIRVFPGPNVTPPPPAASEPPIQLDETVDVEVPAEAIGAPAEAVEIMEEAPPIEEAEIIDDVQPPNLSNESAPLPVGRPPRRGGRGRKTASIRTTRESTTRVPKEARKPAGARKRRTPPPESGD